MSLLPKLTLTLTLTNPQFLTMMKNCYSVRRSFIDDNNDSVSRSLLVFRNKMVVKLTSSAEFSSAEELALLKSPTRHSARITIVETSTMIEGLDTVTFLLMHATYYQMLK